VRVTEQAGKRDDKPASFSVVDAQKRTRWTLEVGKALRLTPEAAGEQAFEVYPARADSLTVNDGALLRRTLIVPHGGRKLLFQLDDAAFEAVIAWLAPRHTAILRRDLLRRLLTVAIVAVGTTVFWPFGWLRVVGVTLPLVLAYAIGVLAAPHRTQVFLASAAMALVAAAEGFVVATAGGTYHVVQLVLALVLALAFAGAYKLARRFGGADRPRLLVTGALAAVAVAAIAVSLARGIALPSVEGAHESAHLQARVAFPPGWYDGQLDEVRTPAPDLELRTARFIAGANVRLARAVIDLIVIRGPALPDDQTDAQVADGAKKFFGELAYLKPAIASCQVAMLRGQRAVRCIGTANVQAIRDEPMQLVTYADAAFRWAMVYFAEDAAGYGEADSIAGSIELLR
jgi:hypothetical protein